MRVFYDFEFLEDGRRIWPISVALKREAGGADSEYYAINEAVGRGKLYHRVRRHRWLMDNVVIHLPLAKPPTRTPFVGGDWYFTLDRADARVKPLWVIANEVRRFLDPGQGRLELWADTGAYDHVALMQLWGPMVSKPDHLPYWTHDIQQYADTLGVGLEDPEFAAKVAVEVAGPAEPHSALFDARLLAETWRQLRTIEIRQQGLLPMVLNTGELVGRVVKGVDEQPPVRPCPGSPRAHPPHQWPMVTDDINEPIKQRWCPGNVDG